MTRAGGLSRHRPAWQSIAAVAGLYVAVAAVYTHPLLGRLHGHVASDPFDPILNASILWWNATTIPFTHAWWTPPFFYPAEGVAAFTENLVGLSVLATPLYWLTGRDPLVTYNLTVFLTWPLSSLAAYLLVLRLVKRHDAAIVAGLAFGFAPYRVAQLAHVQVLSAYWLPIALLGLHAYLEDRRARWLVVFGVAWLLQSLSNGYFMLYGAVLIGLWLVYFGTTHTTRRALPAMLIAWTAATLPLLPVMAKYRAVQDQFGLSR